MTNTVATKMTLTKALITLFWFVVWQNGSSVADNNHTRAPRKMVDMNKQQRVHRQRIKNGNLAKLGGYLGGLVIEQEMQTKIKNSKITADPNAIDSENPRSNGRVGGPGVANGKIIVNVVGHSSNGLKEAISSIPGVEIISCLQHVCSIYCPLDKLLNVANSAVVAFVNTVSVGSSAGSVTTEGDVAMYADQARARYGVTGVGSKLGIISDSFDCLNAASADVASGDLPANYKVLTDLNSTQCADFGGADEGRAMMQLIHDVAPGADVVFRTGYLSDVDMANGIRELMAEGCNVIVDDLVYYEAPFFQDGMIAQAADEVSQAGVAYFTAAQNLRRKAWDEPAGFINSNVVDTFGHALHQFVKDADGNPVTAQQFVCPNSGICSLYFQWDESFHSVNDTVGSRSDLDVFIYHNNVFITQGYVQGQTNNTNKDPIEVIKIDTSLLGSSATTVTLTFTITLVAGPPPTHMRMLGPTVSSFQYTTDLHADIFGHSNAALTAAVGAAHYVATPAYNTSPPRLQSFSSIGPTPILLDLHGKRLAAPLYRLQPRLVGPDGGATTFYNQKVGSVWRFFGTSASAPHVAAVATLVLQVYAATPTQLYTLLGVTAVDMNATGYDYQTGYGLVNALAAVGAVVPTAIPTSTPTVHPTVPPTRAPTRSPTHIPTRSPTVAPTRQPTVPPTRLPTLAPTPVPRANHRLVRRCFNLAKKACKCQKKYGKCVRQTIADRCVLSTNVGAAAQERRAVMKQYKKYVTRC